MGESGLKKIGVIGVGTMGNGISQVAAQSGFDTVVMDVDAGVLERGLEAISRSLDRLVESGQLGAKTGSGFYIWEKYKAVGVNPDVARYRIK